MKPKILSKKLKYKGIWSDIEEANVRLATGKIVKWESVLALDAVAIVAINNEKNIYLSREWRSAWEREILEIPVGQVKGKTEKEMIKQARNELREEVGLDAKKWEKLTTFLTGARQRIKIHVYLAQNLFKSKKKNSDSEIIEVVKMPFQKALKLFLSGKEETTSYTLLGMILAKEKLKL